MTTLLEERPVAASGARAENPAKAPEPITRVSIICSKGSLDMAYPGLILANAARMSGIEATLFFTFWGLDIVTKEKVDHLRVGTVGNPSMPFPTMLGGLPGMESLASSMMKREIAKLEIPTVRELLRDLSDAGAHLYACRMAMDMFRLEKEDLVPEVEDVISAMDFYDKSAGAQIIFI
jgi:peroxiredoxin family protein